MNKAFTVIELSIVLVIVGLLINAILFGSDIVRNSEMTASIKEAQGYLSSIDAFKDAYTQLPGDFNRAHEFWEDECSTATDECNGDGNGLISNNASANDNEAFRAWQHLHLSKFIVGQYNGLGNNVLLGINVPISELRGASYMFELVGNENMLRLGVANGQTNNSPALTVFEALSIDLKIDDGNPDTGNIRASNSSSPTFCVNNGNYTDVANKNIICIIGFVIPND